MEKKFKLGVIGAGFMSSAIIGGALSSDFLSADAIIVTDKNAEAREKIARYNVTVAETKDVFDNAEFVLFAVKPQNFAELKEYSTERSCRKLISIMAGVKRERIRGVFAGAKVARCMPNTPCSVGNGAVGIDLSDYTDERDVEFIKGLFGSFAKVALLDESKLNAVTGISGSSPAYFYLFLKGIIEAGVKQGLDYGTAKDFATNTMIGAGKMVLNNPDKSLDELIAAVCSKGGTTIEAVRIYEQSDLDGISEKAVDACVKRAFELENI